MTCWWLCEQCAQLQSVVVTAAGSYVNAELGVCLPCCLQSKFDWVAGGVANDRPVLSYGPCQFPTLGLIVQRAW